jgi:DNA repair protein RadC
MKPIKNTTLLARTEGGKIGMVREAGEVNYSLTRKDEDVIIEKALSILAKRIKKGKTQFSKPEDAIKFLSLHLTEQEYESFLLILLDSQNIILDIHEMFRGTINSTEVHTRELVKTVLDSNASGIVIAHNHPSGYNVPSQADKTLTENLRKIFKPLEVRVLDHILIAGVEHYSFAENGLI